MLPGLPHTFVQAIGQGMQVLGSHSDMISREKMHVIFPRQFSVLPARATLSDHQQVRPDAQRLLVIRQAL